MKTTLLVVSAALNFIQDPHTLEKQRVEYKCVEYISIDPCDEIKEDVYDISKVYYDVPETEVNINK